ncbi:MAG: sigma 54-interacting transcriptional regulator [Labilithrix sp.]
MKKDRSGEQPTQRSEETSEEASGAFVFTVIDGPDRGAVHAVDVASCPRMLVGKSVTCALRLDDAEVSRRHASLRPEGRGIVVTDLGSTNGTYVNEVAIREALLVGGETLRFGRTVLAVSRGSGAVFALTSDTSFGRMLGASREMRLLYPLLARLAATDEPLLLEGETGTGKELCAEELHACSPRGAERFVVLDTYALPPDDLERQISEVSITRATVYVKEVAALPFGLQRLLARRPTSARFVFGTRRDLDREVERGTFSEDLLVRLAPRRAELPPLRDRIGDVQLLARAFWDGLAGPGEPLPPDFTSRFQRYRWPGNVRELAIAVAARFQRGELARWDPVALSGDETDTIGAVVDRELPLVDARQLVVDELERRYVRHMLARHGSTREAARAADVGVRYFQILRARFDC